MDTFLGNDYLIDNAPGLELFQAIRDLPIIDAHNHADVKEIAENKAYPDIWHLEGATDHYVWELMRKCGVNERLITGKASNQEKWLALAGVFDDIATNPSYEWIHLDLKRFLGIDTLVGPTTGQDIWNAAAPILASPAKRPQALLKQMRVEAMCSTDDPIDKLEHHIALKKAGFDVKVLPTFRPDKAMNIFKADWKAYIKKLEKRVNGKFTHIGDLIAALRVCHDYFAEHGCVASDHGLEIPYAYQVEEADADDVFRRALEGKEMEEDDIIAYMSYVLNEVAALDAEKGWVFQLHIGAVRDVRATLFETLGPDTGGDVSDHAIPVLEPLVPLLNRFDGELKVVLYCLEPGFQATMATLSRAFGHMVSLGSGWWFNDTPCGMKTQLEYVSGVDLLSNHAGMVSDSRKLLSYGSRHEMFRRVLCDVVGRMVARRRLPHSVAERLVVKLAYERPKTLFGL